MLFFSGQQKEIVGLSKARCNFARIKLQMTKAGFLTINSPPPLDLENTKEVLLYLLLLSVLYYIHGEKK